MLKKLMVGLILLFGSIIFFQQQPLVLASPTLQDATPTPAPEEEAAHDEAETEEVAHDETATEEAAEPTLQDLLARIEALEAQNAPASLINQVTTVVYLLDTAGLHALDVRLNEEGVIEAGDAGNVTRVARLLSTVAWPNALAADAETLIDIMDQLATALTEDDLATAAPLATQVHEVQHDLSHAAEHWLGEAGTLGKSAATTEQANQVTTAIYLLDTAGLHALDVRLNEEGVIEASDAGSVTRVARLLSTVDWPAPLATDVVTLTTVLNDLATALTNDDVASAAPLATQVHEVQHDFSHAAEHWLGEASGAHGEGVESDHSDEAADDHADAGAEEAPAEESEDESNDGG